MKKCIFYLPYELDPLAARARMVRPRKMMQAFRDVGYDVFEITGYVAERKERIAALKAEIGAGQRFDFMYAEASTMPTLLTEPHHFPTHPLLDFGFFRYVKKQGIPIGLFYSDIFWKFEDYGKDLSFWKKTAALTCYRYDVKQYERLLDKFYLPTEKLLDYLGSDRLCAVAEALPPGASDIPAAPRAEAGQADDPAALTILYVGGVGGYYQIGELLKAVNAVDRCRMILCCREQDWEKTKNELQPLLSDRIEVVHKSGEELEDCYQRADLCSLMFRHNPYIDMSQPVKAYEYLAHGIPMLATEGMAIADFVKRYDIGWTLDDSAEAIAQQLQACIEHPELLEEKRERCRQARPLHTWKARAEQVALGLKPLGKAK